MNVILARQENGPQELFGVYHPDPGVHGRLPRPPGRLSLVPAGGSAQRPRRPCRLQSADRFSAEDRSAMKLLARWLARWRPERPRCVVAAGAQLGENPRWSARHQRLYWIDMAAGAVHFHEPASGRNHSAIIAAEVGALVQKQSGGLLVGLDDALWELSPELVLGR